MENNSIVLVFIPHQDDEVFFYPYLLMLKSQSKIIKIIYLTNGEFGYNKSIIRNTESINSLKAIGIDSESITFLGEMLNISDGNVIFNLDILNNNLTEIMYKYYDYIYEILMPAWEGGHHDHDATSFLVSFAAKKLGLIHHTRKFYTYNSEGKIKPFFNVIKPLKSDGHLSIFKFSLKDGLKSFLSIRFYKSQLLTFFGLSPQLFLGFIIHRTIYINKDYKNNYQKPHCGELFYERRNRFKYNTFNLHIGLFINIKLSIKVYK